MKVLIIASLVCTAIVVDAIGPGGGEGGGLGSIFGRIAQGGGGGGGPFGGLGLGGGMGGVKQQIKAALATFCGAEGMPADPPGCKDCVKNEANGCTNCFAREGGGFRNFFQTCGSQVRQCFSSENKLDCIQNLGLSTDGGCCTHVKNKANTINTCVATCSACTDACKVAQPAMPYRQ